MYYHPHSGGWLDWFVPEHVLFVGHGGTSARACLLSLQLPVQPVKRGFLHRYIKAVRHLVELARKTILHACLLVHRGDLVDGFRN